MTTINTLLSEVKIYVGTYAKYNNGSILGQWLNLGDYSDLAEFYKACKELHADEQDPEFMFQDYETPELLNDKIWEGGISDDIFEVAQTLEMFEGFDDSQWIDAHNQLCQLHWGENQIYNFDDDFFDVFFKGKPMEAARAACFGELNWSDDYIYFNGYDNLESTSNPDSIIDRSKIVNAYLESPKDFSF